MENWDGCGTRFWKKWVLTVYCKYVIQHRYKMISDMLLTQSRCGPTLKMKIQEEKPPKNDRGKPDKIIDI